LGICIYLELDRRSASSLMVLLACGVLGCADALGASTLPEAASNWLGSGSATLTQSANQAIINQASQRAILNWQRFNIGKDNAVIFNQPGTSAIALNRIFDQNPSLIQGLLKANGQIFLVNHNGIIFANGAQVNVGALVASTLDISDSAFNKGIGAITDGSAAFAGGSIPDGFVRVEAGAQLTAATGGKIMLFAPNVENNGVITTPDGQTILAAGSKVYLAPSLATDTSLRGLLVEVDNGGSAKNLGQILAQRGNITLIGLAVNQEGRVSATTSVNANGSIRLLARDTTQAVTTLGDGSGNKTVSPTHTGTVTLGANSVTEVTPELGDTTTSPGEQTFNPSRVEVMGGQIQMLAGSSIVAAGGQVSLTALANPSNPQLSIPGSAANASRIYLDGTSSIDVAGIENVAVPIERNLVQVDLYGDVLKNSPLVQNSVLRGKTVTVDISKGTPLGDYSGYEAKIGRTVAERSAVGGTVSMASEGDIVVRQGAALNLSGGSLRYQGGYLNTTKLVSQGKIYDISVATPDRVYDGVLGTVTRTHAKWGVTESWDAPLMRGQFTPGYLEGKNAGTVQFIAPAMSMLGTVIGKTRAGIYQRQPYSAALASGPYVTSHTLTPNGAALIVGDDSQASQDSPDFRTPSVSFVTQPTALPGGFDATTALPAGLSGQVELAAGLMGKDAVSNLAVYSNGNIDLSSGVVLRAPAGSVTLQGVGVNVAGNIDVQSGSITLNGATGVTVGGELNASGGWVNDNAAILSGGSATDPLLIKGGTISIKSRADVLIQPGSSLNVSGGGWVDGSGKLAGAADAGAITINSGNGLPATSPNMSKLVLNGTLSGYALGKGGALSLSTGKVRLDDSGSADELVLPSAFFNKGGFSSYTVNGTDGLTVAAGQTVQAKSLSLQLDPASRTAASARSVAGFSQRVLLPDVLRKPSSVSLSASSVLFGKLSVQQGATLAVDAGGSVNLAAGRQMTVDGTLSAPAGTIGLTMLGAPTDTKDPGFFADQSIWLGADAQLLSRGVDQTLVNSKGQRQGEILNGGQVTITANKGYVASEAGSLIDVSGSSGAVDLIKGNAQSATYQRTQVASDAGSINIKTREGALLDGNLLGKAGGTGAQNGSFTLSVDTDNVATGGGGGSSYPVSLRQIVLAQQGAILPTGLKPGDVIDTASYNGKGRITAKQLMDGGFAQVSLQAQHAVHFDGDVSLRTARSIQLDAPALIADSGKTVSLQSSYISLGNSKPNYQAAPAAQGGTVSLTATAALIDLTGNVSLNGFGQTALSSSGDIRLNGIWNQDAAHLALLGSFKTAGDLSLQARQIYPSTLSDFTLAVTGNPSGTLQILGNGSDTPVLSAGGKLTLSAPNIVQDGVLKAPLGEIALAAANALTLGAQSMTSASAQGQIIPFGITSNGKNWLYALDGLTNLPIAAPPQKRVTLNGHDISVQNGAKVDISGGGDLFAYEFIPGPPGRSVDVLAAGYSSTGYAVLPGLSSVFAPYDTQYYAGSSVKPGDSVYLSGAAGLPAGVYPLLPARYALLPGAFLVQTVNGYRDMQPQQKLTLADGTQIVAGYRTVTDQLNTAARYAGYAVRPGTAVMKEAQYQQSYANTFFAQQALAQGSVVPRLPADAGQFVLAPLGTLSMQGDLLQASHPNGGHGAIVDIAVPNLYIGDGVAGAPGNYVSIDATTLSHLNAESLLLGGTRQSATDGMLVNVDSGRIVIANSAATPLTAGEVILAANKGITVSAGSAIEASGTAASSPDLIIGRGGNGDGALLRVANGNHVNVKRENVQRAAGTLDVGGNVLLSGKSVTLDATLDTTSKADLQLAGGSLSLGAGRISLGDISGVNTGLALSGAELAALGSLDGLYLKSYSTLDFYGDLALGGGQSGIQHLALDAGGLRGFSSKGSNTVTLAAGDVLLHNSGAANTDTAVASGGTLTIQGRNGITIAEGEQHVSGFGTTSLDSSSVINGHGTGNLKVAGDLNLQAARVTADAASVQTWTATGKVVVNPAATAAVGAAPIGGSLAITGQRVLNQGHIELAAGTLSLTASGSAADNNVTLAAGSNTSTAGVAKVFGGVTAFAPGGLIKLTSASGNVEVQNGATVDVSGAAGGGDAGRLQTSAVHGQVVLAGTLKGGATKGARQGSYTQDAKTLASFSALNSALEAGQFNALRNIRVRQGDVAVAATDSAHAQQFSLAADAGKLDVSGLIDASGSKGGQIRLAARDNVTLHSGASLQANGSTGAGGQVELDTTSGTINVDSGAHVGVSGASGNAAVDGGQVLLRAPRTAGNTVGITLGNGVINGAKTTVAEAVQVYDNVSTLDASNLAAMQSDATNFMANASSVEAQLGNNAQLRAGIEVRSSGDLTLANDWDLSGWQSGGRLVMLTLRAAGDLNLNGGLSDGFSSAATSAALGSGESAAYRLVSGADMNAANPLANQPLNALASGKGNLTLASGKLIRTGTGNIALAAGRNLVLGDTGSVIYTAGETADAVSGFVAPAASNYAKNGGNLTIAAQGDINGVASHQLITDWLFRQGSLKADGSFKVNPSWWLRYDQFKQGVGALGGGDVAIAAGGNISNLDAVVPTTGRVSGTSAGDASTTIQGGGDLSVKAGGDIRSGVYYVARGHGELTAAGGIVSGRTNNYGKPIHTVLALGDGDFKLTANQDVQIETVMNPTVFAQGTAQRISGVGAGALQKSYFFSYAPDSRVGLLSLSGNTELVNNILALSSVVPFTSLVNDSKNALAIYAPSLTATALQGNVLVDDKFTLFPSAQGNLQLLAAQNVAIGGNINLSDADPALLPGMLNPLTSYNNNGSNLDSKFLSLPYSNLNGGHAATPLHSGDTTPVSIVAQTGDVVASNAAELYLAKSAQIEAGRDITDLSLYAQNLTANDVTSLRAGRDITYTDARDEATGKLVNNSRTIEVDGPGLLALAAGRNINLGNSFGVVTKGNLNNPALPDQGADIAVTVGVKGAPDYSGFATKYGLNGYSEALSQAFFGQLMQAGKEHNAGKDGKLDSSGQVMGYQRGYDAIATLFPGSDYQGDLNLFFSQIKTYRGGNVDLFVPGGAINAGLANVPADLIISKVATPGTPSENQSQLAAKLGVVTQKGGSVRAVSLGDFLVNSSRVFTLQGGDIVLWSSQGNIDAGKGAKTALAVPPPIVTTDAFGNTKVEYQGAATGSGIRVLLTGDALPGEVDLIAPHGTVNAGDAGIGSAGNVNIAAQQVIGAQNINFSGTSTGVPVAQTGSLAAGLTGVSGLAADAGKVGADSAAQAARAQQKPQESLKTAYLNVEVIGFGDDDCKDDEKKNKNDKCSSKQ